MKTSAKKKPSHLYREEKDRIILDTVTKLERLREKVSVVLIHPKYGGNIGAVARLMHNNGLSNLIIAGKDELPEEAWVYAMHSGDILRNSRRIDSLSEIREEFEILVATSSVDSYNGRKFRRHSYSPEEFWKKHINSTGKVAIVFGREDDGLHNGEIDACDCFVNIPANPEYPVYNLSQSVAVLLYEMFKQAVSSTTIEKVSGSKDIEMLISRIEEAMQLTSYPDYKEKNTTVMLRRLMARASLTETEYHKLMGIFRYIVVNLENGRKKDA